MNAIDTPKTYRTRFPELGYQKHANNLWRIVDRTNNNAAIGPHYASKAELLGDFTRYAIDYGCEV
ncbi:MAG: hypothetical protein ACW99U_21745 [Candidatus Thorarchaeota archaeon]